MLRVVENFYDFPDEMYEKAISAKYELISSGNYMGRDSMDRMVMTPELFSKIRQIFPDDHYKIIRSRFRNAMEGDTYMSFIHSDCAGTEQGWHILISLTKNNTPDGLVLYEHEKYGKLCVEPNEDFWTDTCNFAKWSPWKTQPYKYNTAVIVDYGYFHAPMCKTGHGDSIKDSRLLHIIEIVDTRSKHYQERLAYEIEYGTSPCPSVIEPSRPLQLLVICDASTPHNDERVTLESIRVAPRKQPRSRQNNKKTFPTFVPRRTSNKRIEKLDD